jgi:hypothetical protein
MSHEMAGREYVRCEPVRLNCLHGARAALPHLAQKDTPLGRWAKGLLVTGKKTRGYSLRMSSFRPLSTHRQHERYRDLGRTGGRARDWRPEKCSVRRSARRREIGQNAGAANRQPDVA